MNILDIQTLIDENFSEFNFSKNLTLAESDFYDSYSKSFAEYLIDDLYGELRKNYNKDIADFITTNMVENEYIEPFENWLKIPLWYYNAFSFGGHINLSTHNLIYYLAGFMHVIISNNIGFNSSLNILRWYDILDSANFYFKLLSKELNHNQLKTIALFLCYDAEKKELDLSPPSAEDDSTFAKFWYPFLK